MCVCGTDGETLDVVRVTMASTFTPGKQSHKGRGKGKEEHGDSGMAQHHCMDVLGGRRRSSLAYVARGERITSASAALIFGDGSLFNKTVTGEERPAGVEEAYAVSHTSTTVR